MPKLSKIQKADETREVPVDFGDGEVLNVVCYPNRITGKRRRELQDLDEDDTERHAELFFDVLKSWDLQDDTGAVMPFDEETVEALSIPTTIRLFTEIGEAVNPNAKTGRGSKRR